MSGRILPSRRQLQQEITDLRFRAGAYKDSLEDVRRVLEQSFSRSELDATVRYAVILALNAKQGNGAEDVLDAAAEDPAVTPKVAAILNEITIQLALGSLHDALRELEMQQVSE